MGFLVCHYFTFDMEASINMLLNTRFHKTKQQWLDSLGSMQVGVVIYNTKTRKVIFENKQVEDLFGSEGAVKITDKYKSKLKQYRAEKENSEYLSLKKVMEKVIKES